MKKQDDLNLQLFALTFASFATLVSGIFLQNIEKKIFTLPLIIILVPLLTDLNGNFSSIINTKITTKLYLGLLNKKSQVRREELFHFLLLLIAMLVGIYAVSLITIFGKLIGLDVKPHIVVALLISTIVTIFLVLGLISILSLSFAIFLFKKEKDPDDFLIPFSTFLADFLSIIIFSLLINFLV